MKVVSEHDFNEHQITFLTKYFPNHGCATVSQWQTSLIASKLITRNITLAVSHISIIDIVTVNIQINK